MIVGKFTTNGTDYVVVKLENATHVMPETDWKKTYGKLHPERWKKKIKKISINILTLST